MIIMARESCTFNNIRSSYGVDKKSQDRQDLWLYYVVRRISFYPTWLFLKLGISANQATYISMIVGAIGCGFLALGNYGIKIIGALLVNFWIILDCVDGNIARFKKTFSKYGEFVDALSGYLMNALLFLSVGIGAFNHPEPLFEFINQSFAFDLDKSILIILGAWASLAIILPRLIFHKFINTFPEAQSTEIKSGPGSSKSFYHKVYFIIHNVASFSGFLTPILFLATLFRSLSIFVFFYALINTGVLITTTIRLIVKGQRLGE